MKILSRIPILLSFAALLAAPVSAAVESMKIDVTSKPTLSPSMYMDGTTSGQIVVAIAVDETGKLEDTLVLGYTHRGLIASCLEAMKMWTYHPAKVDGVPVPTQAEITIDYTAEGVVISNLNAAEMMNAYLRRGTGPVFVERPCAAGQLDATPARVTTVTPQYAKDAEKQGVRGSVQVHFYIDQNGAVRMPAVNAGAHPYLSDIAVSAVRDWKFQPPTSHGRPVLVAAVQEFNFGK
jgi:TonB family protein